MNTFAAAQEPSEVLPPSLEAWMDLRREIQEQAKTESPWKWPLALAIALCFAAAIAVEVWLKRDVSGFTWFAAAITTITCVNAALEARMNRRWKLLLKALQRTNEVLPKD